MTKPVALRAAMTRAMSQERTRSRTREQLRGWSPRKAKDVSSSTDSRRSATSRSSSKESKEDEIIHYDWAAGQVLNARYRLESLSGDGTFGRVCLATDLVDRREVAIKIIRDVRRYQENAKVEAKILAEVAREDHRGKYHCCLMFDTFTHDSRFFCLVFEPLGSSLYDVIKKNHFRGLWLSDVQKVAKQSLKALKFLHGRLQLTHTDLKAENILFVERGAGIVSYFPREDFWEASTGNNARGHPYYRPTRADIKLIDFGNATFANEHHSSIINTRQYRGPEVVMELGWDHKSDIWSIGCILMELYTGELLFGTHDNLEHLALMEKILRARLPQDMLLRTTSEVRRNYLRWKNPHHGGELELNWPGGASCSSESHVAMQKKLPELVRRRRVDEQLMDFVQKLLEFRPSNRPSAEGALSHDFLSLKIDDSDERM